MPFGIPSGATGAAGAAGAAAAGPLGWASLGASLLGGIGSGIVGGQQAAEAKKNREQQIALQRQLASQSREGMRREAMLTEGQQANVYGRQRETNPLRDRLLYTLMARMGQSPGAFKPRDVFNPTISAGRPELGGINLGALQQAQSQYTPGAGGVSNEMTDALLQNLGYSYGPGGEVSYAPIHDVPAISDSSRIPSRPGDSHPEEQALWDQMYGDRFAQRYGDVGGNYGEGRSGAGASSLEDKIRSLFGRG